MLKCEAWEKHLGFAAPPVDKQIQIAGGITPAETTMAPPPIPRPAASGLRVALRRRLAEQLYSNSFCSWWNSPSSYSFVRIQVNTRLPGVMVAFTSRTARSVNCNVQISIFFLFGTATCRSLTTLGLPCLATVPFLLSALSTYQQRPAAPATSRFGRGRGDPYRDIVGKP